MTQWLTLSRAARLIGVSRGALQRQVRDGELPTNDGLVSTEGLLRLYPQWSVEDSGAFERVARLKDEAFGRRVQERVLPPQEVLAQRLLRAEPRARRRCGATCRATTSSSSTLRRAARRARGDRAARRISMSCARRSTRGLADVLATESADALTIMDDMLKVVSAHVTVRPSGHEFFVEGRDTLLQAGLKAGLKLNYGCGNGTCGLCKARVVVGEVVKAMPYDYPLSEAERAQGYTLLCAHSAGSSRHRHRDARGARARRHSRAGDRGARARRPAARRRTRCCCTCRRRARTACAFSPGRACTLYGGAGGVDAQALPDRELPLRRPQPALPRRARRARRVRGAALRRRAARRATRDGLSGPTGDFVLARERAAAGVRRLRHRLRAGEEPDRARDGASTARSRCRSTGSPRAPDGHYLANQCRAWAAAFDGFRYARARRRAMPATGARGAGRRAGRRAAARDARRLRRRARRRSSRRRRRRSAPPACPDAQLSRRGRLNATDAR